MNIRFGIGFDVHEFATGRKLILGGITIPSERGLMGHSDADVLLHAITDAILGALALGDIGAHFPDNNPRYKNADSAKLLEQAYKLVVQRGYSLNNLDSVIMAQQPRLAPYISRMQQKTAQILNTSPENISIKATTTEKLGFVGRGEGIAAQAIVSLIQVPQ